MKRTIAFAAVILLCAILLPAVCISASEYLRGDVNQDGSVNSKDYVMLKRFVLGTYRWNDEASTDKYPRGDVNQDNAVNSKDYVMLKRFVLGTYRWNEPYEENRKVSSIKLSAPATTVAVGNTLQISAKVLPDDAENRGVTYTISSGSSYAAINENGLLTAKKAGKVTVKATAKDGSNVSATLEITVGNAGKEGLLGSGTKSDPYLIGSESDLKAMAKVAAKKDLYYTQISDITLTESWKPIAKFAGNYDGQGYYIKSLHFLIDEDTFNYGIFQESDNATFRNMVLKDVSTVFNGGGGIGAVVGNANDTRFENISAEVSFTYADRKVGYIGGICGTLYVEKNKNGGIFNCSVKGTVKGEDYVGGIAGVVNNQMEVDMDPDTYVSHYNALTIKGCTFDGTLEGVSYTGGIVGSTEKTDIEQCAVRMKATTTRRFVGGIVAEFNGGSIGSNSSSRPTRITECAADVDITGTGTSYGDAFFGGIAGYMQSYYGIDVNNCSATGEINCASSWSDCQDRSTYDGGIWVRYRNPCGALIGYLHLGGGKINLTKNAANVAVSWTKHDPCDEDYAYCKGSLVGWLHDTVTRDLMEDQYKSSGKNYNSDKYIDITEDMLTGTILGCLDSNYCVSTERDYFEAHPRIVVKNGSYFVSSYKSMPRYTIVTNITADKYVQKETFSGFNFSSAWTMTANGPVPTAVKDFFG